MTHRYAHPGRRRLGWPHPAVVHLLVCLLIMITGVFYAPERAGATDSATIPPAGALRVTVTTEGIQRISGSQLLAAGLNLTGLNPALLQLRRTGLPVPLELRGTGDGTFDPADELRFYAPPPGDRWNRSDTYWLAVEATPGARMSTRTAHPGSSPVVSTSAFERHTWRAPAYYDSRNPGPSGDYWYSLDLRTDPETLNPQPASASIPFSSPLTPISGGTSLTVSGVATVAGPHRLEAMIGGSTAATDWSGSGIYTRTLTPAATANQAQIRLMVGTSQPSFVKIDRITWERPVALANLAVGAKILGRSGIWCYRLSGAQAGRTIYDISEPHAPQIVQATPTADCDFRDGPEQRTYMITGSQTLTTPQVQPRATAILTALPPADAIYVVPPALADALAPLVAHRRAGGYRVAVVDPQAIYDGWSYGQVDPRAIRSFVKYASTAWNPAPVALILVGDGSSDPFDYTKRGANNVNLIPPYLAPVDLALGETACENCFVQIDGDDALADEMPDLAIGRLPVKNAAELNALVGKILGYEQNHTAGGWRSRAVLLADNADYAGDFAAIADLALPIYPRQIWISRIYYDPQAGGATAWREPDARQARSRTIAAFNAGAGLISYVGHSNQWQWAVTIPELNPSSMLGLFDPDTLTNGSRLPIVLTLTCLSSAFQTPALSGTTIDERLLLAPDGGAIAVWGSTGLGVAYGHDRLQQGFLKALWQVPLRTRTIGELTLAGYRELHDNSLCCRESLRSYALLGDPLTPAKIGPAQRIMLPTINR